MAIWFENLICQGVLLIGEHSSTFLRSHNHFTKDVSTIGEYTFIVLEDPSGVSKVMIGTFIILDGPANASKGITILIEGHTPVGIVPGFLCPVDVPPNPPYLVAASKASVRDDHF